MAATERYLRKNLILIQDLDIKEHVTDYFQHPIILDDLPQTMLISPKNDTIDFWYGQQKKGGMYNRFYVGNSTFLYHEKPFFPEIDDLTGIELKVATINYPPYTYYEFVVRTLSI